MNWDIVIAVGVCILIGILWIWIRSKTPYHPDDFNQSGHVDFREREVRRTMDNQDKTDHYRK